MHCSALIYIHKHTHAHQHLTLHLKLIIHWSATDYLQEAEATENDRKSFPVSVVGVCLFVFYGRKTVTTIIFNISQFIGKKKGDYLLGKERSSGGCHKLLYIADFKLIENSSVKKAAS